MTLPKRPCDYLIFDISNVLYRTFFANKNEDASTIVGLATHQGLLTLNKYYKLTKPTKGVIMAFDRGSWRKEYTATDLCISGKPYKGNRRKDLSPRQQLKFEAFIGHLREFEGLITKHSTIKTLACEMLEADDLIAGFIQKFGEDNNITLISTDSDFMQLMYLPNLTILCPDTKQGVARTLDEFDDDATYYLFHKCIRGDSTDNVQSAYPKVRETRIKKAYVDAFERVQMMKETWKNEDNKEFVVGDLFEENQLLIDLSAQPENIREKIDQTIDEEMNKDKKFALFYFMKYLGKHDLKKISESFDQYLPLLAKS